MASFEHFNWDDFCQGAYLGVDFVVWFCIQTTMASRKMTEVFMVPKVGSPTDEKKGGQKS